MAQYTVQSVVAAGTTPAVITPTASDTISINDIGTRGVILRVITTGTATNVSVLDPTLTDLANAGTVVPIACPATGVRMIYVSPNAVNQATGVATVTFSGALTGVTVEAYRY
jgi:N-acyl-D-aspartate/D-glutamate deacylase